MASTNTSQEVIAKSLSEQGFFGWDDASAGSRLSELERREFPYYTEYGLDFLADFAFHPNILPILENLFDPGVLGHWLRYEAYLDHIQCFRRGGRNAGRRVFMIHVWSKGSQVDYYTGSHLHTFETTRGLRSIYEVQSEELRRAGCEPEARDFASGGLVILDARVCFEIKQGYALTFMFATEDVVAGWAKIVLPRVLKAKVAEIQKKSTKIRLGFTFEDANAEETSRKE